jgi:bifunctional N-acetylglucosamine-1-phosphate-uridyltransferase/glucosamine-1-phosphate-acetyltransferase GlmU-like protein
LAPAKLGNFVETKAATLEAGAKVNSLSYVGDAHVGANANLGAGTITCNYDGFFKHKTTIGEGGFRGHQLLAGGAGENRQRRLYRRGVGHHQGRA